MSTSPNERYGRYEPVFRGQIARDRRLNDHVIRSINETRAGGLNVGGEFELELSQTTTEVLDDRVTADSVILFFAEDANGAAENAMFVSTRTPGVSFTLSGHANAITVRTFRYIIVG